MATANPADLPCPPCAQQPALYSAPSSTAQLAAASSQASAGHGLGTPSLCAGSWVPAPSPLLPLLCHTQAEALPGILAAAVVQLARLGQVRLLQQLLLHCKGDQLYGLGPWALQRTIQQAGALDTRCSAGMGWGVPPGEVLLEAGLPALRATAAAGHAAAASLLLLWGADPHHQVLWEAVEGGDAPTLACLLAAASRSNDGSQPPCWSMCAHGHTPQGDGPGLPRTCCMGCPAACLFRLGPHVLGSALVRSAALGHVPVVQLLLEHAMMCSALLLNGHAAPHGMGPGGHGVAQGNRPGSGLRKAQPASCSSTHIRQPSQLQLLLSSGWPEQGAAGLGGIRGARLPCCGGLDLQGLRAQEAVAWAAREGQHRTLRLLLDAGINSLDAVPSEALRQLMDCGLLDIAHMIKQAQQEWQAHG
ncbi:hypothetical protein V8C86DRAFT_2676254 [Haematococcus lacustris]